VLSQASSFTGRLRDVCAGHGSDRSASGELTLESEASADVSAGARVDARLVRRTVSDRPGSARVHASITGKPVETSLSSVASSRSHFFVEQIDNDRVTFG